jgi:hypothetical protein
MISTVLVSLLISAADIVIQAGMAFGFGAPMLRVFGSRQTVIEAPGILPTAAAHAGLIALGRFSDPPSVTGRRVGDLLAVFAAAASRRSLSCSDLPTARCCETFKSRFAAGLARFAVMGAVLFHLRLRPWRPPGAG